ncbi:MAG: hypothetical protein LC793_24140 [Thermomicrobia bacterium]|nr:hypothetical protein [Thermomicrobia bacterium]
MAAVGIRDISVREDRFLRQVVSHHATGDHYPDPWMIGAEMHLTRAQTDAIVGSLRTIGWIAASPYDPERLRLTPRCWDSLRRAGRSRAILARNAA